MALPEIPVVYSLCIDVQGARADLAFEARRLVERVVRMSADPEALRRDPVISGYRSFLETRVGSGLRVYPEVLIREAISGRSSRYGNPVVDIVIAVSMCTGIAMSPLDADRVVAPLRLLYLAAQTVLKDFRGREIRIPRGSAVLVDASNRVLYVYPYKLTDAAPITAETRRVLIVGYGAPSIPITLVEQSVRRVVDYLESFIRGASCSQPEVSTAIA